MEYLFTLIYLIIGLTGTVAQKCADIDPSACQLMHSSRPDLCSDQVIAKSACPRFCKLCPVECYHCSGALADYHLCNTTMVCKPDEVCMRKELKSFIDGHHEYELKCEDKHLCDGGSDLVFHFGKRSVETRDVSATCCAEDLCNYPNSVQTATTSPPGCYKDIIFLFDQSARYLRNEQAALMDLIINVTKQLDIGRTENLVALYGYDTRVDERISLRDHSDKASLLADLEAEKNANHAATSGHSNTSEAIDYLVSHIIQSRYGDRSNYPDAIVLIGDWTTAQNLHLTLRERTELQQASNDVIIVSIGGRWGWPSGSGLGSTNNLDALATDNQHVVHVTNLLNQDASLVDTIVSLLKKC